MFRRSVRFATVTTILAVALTACLGEGDGGGGGSSPGAATTATGPISIWYSNNPEEVAWGEAVVAAWNADHPDEEVTAEEIPAGDSSEEVISASITAGNTPCLIFNTAPAAVPQFQQAGGLVALDDFSDGASYIQERTGDRAEQYKFTDGLFYQMPWKTNPVMIFYNKTVFETAGLDPENPPLRTYDEFLATAETLVAEGGVEAAIWPSPDAQFFQPWFDFYPLFIAQSGGQQLVEEGEPQFNNEAGLAAANFWRSLYDQGLVPNEAAAGDAFADQMSAMSIVGPWAIKVYGDKVDWGVVPVPTQDGMDASEVHTFSDEKSSAMYTSCENRGTAWEFLKFATSEESDGQLLELTGQMPMRADVVASFPDYFEANPDYEPFADQASRTVEVPIVPNSIEMWQTFRTAYSESVIFGTTPVDEAFNTAADEVRTLVGGS